MTYLQKYTLSKTKDVNVKTFNIITRINEAKILVKHISCDCKSKHNSTICNCNQKWNNNTCQCECKILVSAKKIMVGILAHALVRIVGI